MKEGVICREETEPVRWDKVRVLEEVWVLVGEEEVQVQGLPATAHAPSVVPKCPISRVFLVIP